MGRGGTIGAIIATYWSDCYCVCCESIKAAVGFIAVIGFDGGRIVDGCYIAAACSYDY